MDEQVPQYGLSVKMDPAPDHPFNDDTKERVGCIVYDAEGKLLIVDGGTGKMSLPKGCRHLAETVWEGSIRELYEETGLDIEDLLLDKTATFVKEMGLRWGTYMVFKLKTLGAELKLRPQAGEVIKILWKNPHGFWIQRKADLNADLRHLVKRM
jgi:8-oxo-dGTP pyrophosphatase MutT (NUDIX family)